MTEIQTLRFKAKLMAPTAHGNNEAMAKLDALLDRLGELLPLDQFEALCASLTRAHSGAGYTS